MSAGTPSTAIASGKLAKNPMLYLDSSMFSGRENSRRTPPDARGVDASVYAGSRSTTATSAPGSSSFTK